METENKTNNNCNCGDDCCKPKKSKLWTKILFFIVIATALSIVTFKIVANNKKAEVKPPVVIVDSIKKPSCCDTTQPNICTKVSDPNKPCCPQSKN